MINVVLNRLSSKIVRVYLSTLIITQLDFYFRYQKDNYTSNLGFSCIAWICYLVAYIAATC